jgi:hypothetical protein
MRGVHPLPTLPQISYPLAWFNLEFLKISEIYKPFPFVTGVVKAARLSSGSVYKILE